MEKLWHALDITEVEDELDTDSGSGLNNQAVDKRGKSKKSNETLKTLRTFFNAFFSGFADITVVILAISAVVSFFMGAGADAILILCITVLNSLIGALRSVKNHKITGYAHSLRSPMSRVIRADVEKLVSAEDVVCGDVIALKKGDVSFFNCRITYSDGMKLKGEASDVRDAVCDKLEAEADTPFNNMLYPGDFVVSGQGRAIVCSEYEAKDDEIISTDIKEFGLHKKLIEVSRIVTAVIAAFCIGIFAVGVLQNRDMFEMLVVSACLAAAAVPNGLYSVVYSVLFAGAKMLGDKNITVNSLYAADALSCINCICTDKEGILTESTCKAECAAVADKSWNISEYGISDNDRSIIKMLFDFCVLTSDITDNGDVIIGAPFDAAIACYAKSNGTLKSMIDKKYAVVSKNNFENHSVTTVKIKDGYRVIAKGDTESIIDKCSECVLSDGISLLSDEIKEEIYKKKKAMSENAMRVVAVAFKDVGSAEQNEDNDFIFGGIIGVLDSVSQEVVKAVSVSEKAGIKVVVTDSDCADAVFAVAARSGIAKADDNVISGAEIDTSDSTSLAEKVRNVFAFSSLKSGHKSKITAALKDNGYSVAATGNMNNDASEIECADIGISVNQERCTQISNKADIVIDKGNFSTLVGAVNIGRGIQSNIRRVTSLVITCGLSMLVLMTVALMIFPEIPLLPIHILWTSLIIDSLAAFALSSEPADKRLMRDKPRNKDKSVFAGGVWKRIIFNSVVIGLLGLFAFMCGRYYMQSDGMSDAQALLYGRTMAFAVISISQLFNAFNLKSEYTLFNANIVSNFKLIISFAAGILIQVLVISLPVVNTVFGVCALDGAKWITVIVLSFVTVVLNEIVKISSALLKHKKTDKIKAEGI